MKGFRLLLLIPVLIPVLFSVLVTNSAVAEPAKEMDRLARELVVGLNKHKLVNKGARLAIVPFDISDIPIRTDVAESLNDVLMQALNKRSRGRYRLVARSELSTIMSDVEQTGASDYDGVINRLMENAASIDVLITGTIRPATGGVNLSYKAIDLEGNVIVVTTQKLIELSEDQLSLSKTVLTLEAALDQAAKHFAYQVSDLMILVPKGVRYQSSGAQPDVGRYIEEKFVTQLVSEYDSVITDRRLRVQRPRALPPMQHRGLTIKHKQLAPEPSRPEGVYELEGSYWNFADAVEVRLSLLGSNDESIAWSERVQKASFPAGLVFEPPEDLQQLRDTDEAGAIDLYLSTSHGEDPVYRVGDNIELVMRSSQDAWLYCFYRQANGETIQILPNAYMSQSRDLPTLRADRETVIPDARIFPFAFEVTEPLGAEIVKCFATNRDITRQLPESFRGESLDPISPSLVQQMSRLVRRSSDAEVTEASVVITVVEKEAR
jgi:TolB-like protein